jgi:protein-disulfide isomerase
MHPHAEIAAESAEFASAAGLFWDMHDALFENQSRLSMFELTMVSAARGLGITS